MIYHQAKVLNYIWYKHDLNHRSFIRQQRHLLVEV